MLSIIIFLILILPMPDQLVIFIDFPDSMEGNFVNFAVLIGDLKEKMIAWSKVDFG